MKIKVGINGMGRIGRMILRTIVENNFKNIEIKHINNRTNSEACSALLKYDSIHGKFNAELDFDDDHLIINKNKITFSFTPNTIVLSAFLHGADTMTFFAPFFKWGNNFSLELNLPVHSKT